MASGILAAFVSVLAWGFVEALGRFYPARATWWRLRRMRGREHVRRMRERVEVAAGNNAARRLTVILLVLTVAWVAAASLLDKRWYEVVADATPSIIVMVAFYRVPAALDAVAERMKTYEREAGEDPDKPLDENGEPGAATAVL